MDLLTFDYPDFTFVTYRQVLAQLAARFRIQGVRDVLTEPHVGGTLVLRHDIDFSPALSLPMAEIESELGLRSSYFAALHLHYNPHVRLHADALRRIASLGHEIGFHYDSTAYEDATNSEARMARLEQHVRTLEEICRAPVASIARHNPSIAAGHDPFRTGTPFHNAYDPKLFHDTIYLSDSCRGWRGGGLGQCWSIPKPRCVYLLIHPELWSEAENVERIAYLELLRLRVLDEHIGLYDEVREVWQSHAGGQEHDRRVMARKNEETLA